MKGLWGLSRTAPKSTALTGALSPVLPKPDSPTALPK